MKVLVTGGAGFIGSHIVDRLVQAGVQVYVLDNLSTGKRENIHPLAVFLHKDIRDRNLTDLFCQAQFDYVIHQAAQTTVPKSMEDPRYDCEVNILGMVNILEACRKAGTKRIIFASSAAVYGDTQQLPIEETAGKKPTSFYGLSKLTEEHYLDMYYENFGMEYVVLRYANVYGERQAESGEGGVISIFLKKLLAEESITVYGDGTQTRDFIYVRDVAEANYQALFTSHVNDSYNISTSSETSLRELLHLLSGIVQKNPDIYYAAARENDIFRSVLNNATAQVKLGWQPKHTLAVGLGHTFADMQNRYESQNRRRKSVIGRKLRLIWSERQQCL